MSRIKGSIPWNKGKTKIYSESTILKMKNSHLGQPSGNKGHNISEEAKKEISKRNKGSVGYWKNKKLSVKHINNLSISHTNKNGNVASNWQGGKLQYTKKQVLKRDNYTCQRCGISDKDVLEVDHIVPKVIRPDLALDVSNMVTLCANCHAKKTRLEFRNKIYGNTK